MKMHFEVVNSAGEALYNCSPFTENISAAKREMTAANIEANDMVRDFPLYFLLL